MGDISIIIDGINCPRNFINGNSGSYSAEIYSIGVNVGTAAIICNDRTNGIGSSSIPYLDCV